MDSFEIMPCIYYLSDKNLDEQEHLKLFVYYGEIFNITPELTEKFTHYAADTCRLYPRSFNSDEIGHMKNKIIKPHAKRVNPYGCYDITRYGTFFNINVPKSICQGCPYSIFFKNARKDSEKIIIAAILDKNPVPDKIQTELSSGKAANAIMPSVLTVQGREKHTGKFDVIELNAFLLKYILSNYNLIKFESADKITSRIKSAFKTVLLKDMELSNTPDYVFEMLCRELQDISNIGMDSRIDEGMINEISEELVLPYKYDRAKAVDIAKGKIEGYSDAQIITRHEADSLPIVIEPVEIPIADKTVSIICRNSMKHAGSDGKKILEKCKTVEKDRQEIINDKEENRKSEKDRLSDPERYYPDTYEINIRCASGNIKIIDNESNFPFLWQADNKYMIAAEICSLNKDKGLLLCDENGKYYFYRFCRLENKPLKELMRRRPLMITMNSVELHAGLREYRIYENRTADLKDMYAAYNASDNMPDTFRSLFEKMNGEKFSECEDFYLNALKHYKCVYKSYLEKMHGTNFLDTFECHTAVSTAIGCSWHVHGVFENVSGLYERKSLFEYRSLCPKEISAKVQGSFYCYRVRDVPAKNERFYSGLVRELVKMESVKLGKVIVLKVSEKGLFLFAFETCGTTYELLQWPCVCLARKLNIKNSHVHYYRKVCTIDEGLPQHEHSENVIWDKEIRGNVFNIDLC